MHCQSISFFKDRDCGSFVALDISQPQDLYTLSRAVGRSHVTEHRCAASDGHCGAENDKEMENNRTGVPKGCLEYLI